MSVSFLDSDIYAPMRFRRYPEKYSFAVVAKTASVSPLVLWNQLMPHQTPHFMVDCRFSKIRWQTNGEAVHCIVEYASPSTSSAIGAHVHRAPAVLPGEPTRGNPQIGEPLWSLHALDIEDKHRLLIAKKDVTHIRTVHCKDGAGEYFTVTEWAMIHPNVSVYPCIGRKNVQIADKGEASFGIVFGDGMPFYGKAILPTLRNLSHFVSRAIDSLESVWIASRVP